MMQAYVDTIGIISIICVWSGQDTVILLILCVQKGLHSSKEDWRRSGTSASPSALSGE